MLNFFPSLHPSTFAKHYHRQLSHYMVNSNCQMEIFQKICLSDFENFFFKNKAEIELAVIATQTLFSKMSHSFQSFINIVIQKLLHTYSTAQM